MTPLAQGIFDGLHVDRQHELHRFLEGLAVVDRSGYETDCLYEDDQGVKHELLEAEHAAMTVFAYADAPDHLVVVRITYGGRGR